MQKIPYLLLAVITVSFLLNGCEKETTEQNEFVPNPPPDLCGKSDNCDDGILDDLLLAWRPIGGVFDGNAFGGCVNPLCPDIRVTFLKDSTYLIKTIIVVQDSSGVWTEEATETGTYLVRNCTCTQTGNWWDGYRMEKKGRIYCSPDAGDAYEMSFLRNTSNLYLTDSSRDSTLILFMF